VNLLRAYIAGCQRLASDALCEALRYAWRWSPAVQKALTLSKWTIALVLFAAAHIAFVGAYVATGNVALAGLGVLFDAMSVLRRWPEYRWLARQAKADAADGDAIPTQAILLASYAAERMAALVGCSPVILWIIGVCAATGTLRSGAWTFGYIAEAALAVVGAAVVCGPGVPPGERSILKQPEAAEASA
jgi:hypothetical protein